MQRALTKQFPALAEAAGEATGGCGRLALQWRPLQPAYSKVHLAFDGGLDPDVFCVLSSPALSTVRRALGTVAAALPEGAPFPRRPNTATGLFEHKGRCLAVRYREHQREGDSATQRSVVLLPDGEATNEHPEDEAARGIVAYLAPEERERWYER